MSANNGTITIQLISPKFRQSHSSSLNQGSRQNCPEHSICGKVGLIPMLCKLLPNTYYCHTASTFQVLQLFSSLHQFLFCERLAETKDRHINKFWTLQFWILKNLRSIYMQAFFLLPHTQAKGQRGRGSWTHHSTMMLISSFEKRNCWRTERSKKEEYKGKQGRLWEIQEIITESRWYLSMGSVITKLGFCKKESKPKTCLKS